MTQLKTFEEMVGKTISAGFPEFFTNDSDLVIFFDDNSFVILESEPDMDSQYHSNFIVNPCLTDEKARDLDLITYDEWLERVRERQFEDAKGQLEDLKHRYPELFTTPS